MGKYFDIQWSGTSTCDSAPANPFQMPMSSRQDAKAADKEKPTSADDESRASREVKMLWNSSIKIILGADFLASLNALTKYRSPLPISPRTRSTI